MCWPESGQKSWQLAFTISCSSILSAFRGAASRLKSRLTLSDSSVMQLILPEPGLGDPIHPGVHAHPDFEPGMALLDDRKQERKRYRHRTHPGGLDIFQQRFDLPLSLPGELAVVHARGVQQVVEADPLRFRLLHMALESPARQWREGEGGPASADCVGRELAEDLRDRIPGKGIEKPVVEVGRYRQAEFLHLSLSRATAPSAATACRKVTPRQ